MAAESAVVDGDGFEVGVDYSEDISHHCRDNVIDLTCQKNMEIFSGEKKGGTTKRESDLLYCVKFRPTQTLGPLPKGQTLASLPFSCPCKCRSGIHVSG